jgi:hypothetical protein
MCDLALDHFIASSGLVGCLFESSRICDFCSFAQLLGLQFESIGCLVAVVDDE